MTEELVTLETAKLLKEKGFVWECERTISCDKIIRRWNHPQYISCCTEIDGELVEFLCPTLYVAQKWLRETKNLHIEIYRSAVGYGYAIVKADNGTWQEDDDSRGPNDGGLWDTYEEALEAGIQEALKLI
ncbi:hypothetical protein [Bacteroides uniformis]|jgi:hypothetical protein|uniref:hypothetical protein n=1 Tax=Bacteroides uniformis TaxID=820 RepID=UPI0019209E0F|nr:hypothetical protein [Bacteroides uniformis]